MKRARRHEFSPYMVRNSQLTIEDVYSNVNKQVYRGYGSNYGYGGSAKVVAGSAFDFELLLRDLVKLEHLEFVSHHELLSKPCPKEKVRVGIRHDIDADIVAALQQAEIEAEYGIVANWAVLHTAWYYGVFDKGVFYRNSCMGHVYKRMYDLGHEVSLHSDPLLVYQDYGIDGAQAVKTEIEWLRSLGIQVKGSVAHNHRPRYGAENYEVFKGYLRQSCEFRGVEPTYNASMNGKTAPLGVIDEHELGLEYEGNQIFWQQHTPLEYGATRFAYQWRWNQHLKRLKRDKSLDDTVFIDQERLIRDIGSICPGTYLVLVVHPCYYGARHREDQKPARRINFVKICQSDSLGWFTYKPHVVQCFSGTPAEPQEYQTINHANEYGMLDKPFYRTTEDVNFRALIVGGKNIDGLAVPVPIQVQARLEDLINTCTDNKSVIVKLAHGSMGLDRLWGWIEKVSPELMPNYVFIGIGDQVLRYNSPEFWSKETGCSAKYPAGDYVIWKDGEVTTVAKHKDWKHYLLDPEDQNVMQSVLKDLTNKDCRKRKWIINLYRFVCEQVRNSGAKPVLFVEENGEHTGNYGDNDKKELLSKYLTSVSSELEKISKEVGVDMIDPYESILAVSKEGLRTHNSSPVEWAPASHRIVADALFDYLKEDAFL